MNESTVKSTSLLIAIALLVLVVSTIAFQLAGNRSRQVNGQRHYSAEQLKLVRNWLGSFHYDDYHDKPGEAGKNQTINEWLEAGNEIPELHGKLIQIVESWDELATPGEPDQISQSVQFSNALLALSFVGNQESLSSLRALDYEKLAVSDAVFLLQAIGKLGDESDFEMLLHAVQFNDESSIKYSAIVSAISITETKVSRQKERLSDDTHRFVKLAMEKATDLVAVEKNQEIRDLLNRQITTWELMLDKHEN